MCVCVCVAFASKSCISITICTSFLMLHEFRHVCDLCWQHRTIGFRQIKCLRGTEWEWPDQRGTTACTSFGCYFPFKDLSYPASSAAPLLRLRKSRGRRMLATWLLGTVWRNSNLKSLHFGSSVMSILKVIIVADVCLLQKLYQTKHATPQC